MDDEVSGSGRLRNVSGRCEEENDDDDDDDDDEGGDDGVMEEGCEEEEEEEEEGAHDNKGAGESKPIRWERME